MDWKEKYQALFNHIVEVKYGRPIEFPAIERKVSHLRDGDAIRYEDLEAIAREDLWPFKKYWMWPAREQIEDKLENSWGWIIDPAAKWDEEEDMIGRLLDLFKQISLMSILLRFVWPEHYAIYSRAELQLLQIERGQNDTQEYMNLVTDMRALRLSFGLERTADVDMIVWVCTQSEAEREELCNHLKLKLPGERSPLDIIKESRSDPLKTAEVYFDSDMYTAGYWASRAFERVLREECRRFLGYVPRCETREFGNIEYLIHCLCEHRPYRQHQKLMLNLKGLRNDVVHAERPFNREKARLLLEGVRELKQIFREAAGETA